TLTGRQLATITQNLVTPIAFTHNGRVLAGALHDYQEGSSRSKTKALVLVETLTGKEISRISLTQASSIGFSPDDRVLATADAQALNLWDSTMGKLLLRRPWPPELVYRKGWSPAWSLTFMPNGRALATGLDDGTIIVWDLDS